MHAAQAYLLSLLCAGAIAAAPTVAAETPTQADVRAAQARWCTALIEIGRAQTAGGDVRAAAARLLDTLYDFRADPAADDVLFKPTLAYGAHTFRTDRRGALAYFVGGDAAYPEDRGFALRPWTQCTPRPAGVVDAGDAIVAMGKVRLIAADGREVEVDKTFVYRRTDAGLRVIAHMSALPYQPPSD